jgi:negative regulator of flagellin synthesis FlgM
VVDPISMKTGTAVARLASVNGVNKVGAAAAVAGAAPAVQTEATALTSEMAAKPPVDAARVAQIKQAIERGSFALAPEAVADRLLTLRSRWNSHD